MPRIARIVRTLPLVALLALVAFVPGTLAQNRLTLEDIHASPKYIGTFFQGGRWAETGPVLLYVRGNADGSSDLMQVNVETDRREVVIAGSGLRKDDDGAKALAMEDYTYSKDGRKVLFFTDSSPVWRYNTQGYYYVYDLDTRRVVPVSAREPGTQLFAKFSPDGSKVAFVRNRNLYVKDLATGQERALTTDGADGSIINGTTDWVYEEEFGLRDAFQWSPDGRRIAFMQFDESNERMFDMIDNRDFYPKVTAFRYPKAGTPNAEVRLGVIDVASGATRFFDTGTWRSQNDATEYLPQFGWTPANAPGGAQVWALRMNRDQNDATLLYGDPASMAVRTILRETSPTWLEVETGFTDLTGGTLTFLDSGQGFVWVSERDGYRHLYLYKTDGTFVRPLTRGPWDVTGFLGADEANGTIFFAAAKESPMERHIYRQVVDLTTGAATGRTNGRGATTGRGRGATSGRNATTPAPPEPVRLTLEAGWHDADLSRDRRYFIDSHSTLEQPTVVTLRRTGGTIVRTLEGNDALRRTLAQTRRPRVEWTTVPAADGTTRLNAMVWKPSTFDASKKYPVLLYVYGGPGSQTVKNQWGGSRQLWHEYLAEELGVVVVSVDNRGTGARGNAFKTVTYKRLGQLEAQDQIAAARYIGQQSWADASRLGIWGWSYGGFTTLNSLLMGAGPQTFRVGMAVAPVTDWKQYDTIYTERFLSTPQNNPAGYTDGSPIRYAANLADHQHLLIVHGDLDDNVHLQNTTQMTYALQNAGKPFDLMIYPGKNHGIGGRATRLHLFRMMTDYVRDNLIGR